MEMTVPGEKVAWGLVCGKCSVSVSKPWTSGLCEGPGEGGGCTSPPVTSYRNLPIHVLIIYLCLSFLSGVFHVRSKCGLRLGAPQNGVNGAPWRWAPCSSQACLQDGPEDRLVGIGPAEPGT